MKKSITPASVPRPALAYAELLSQVKSRIRSAQYAAIKTVNRELIGMYWDIAPLVREIGWSHNLLIMERCKAPLERVFYLRMTRKFGWSKNVLAHQIDNQSYEKSLLKQTNFTKTLTPALQNQAQLAVKDEYIFDFLELGDQHGERELELALIGWPVHFMTMETR